MKKEENYYELLKVERNANVSEIVTAYHAARNAFSKESLAIYSLFTVEETEAVLKKLEEAYLTLSNLDRKREYDRALGLTPAPQPPEQTLSEFPRPAAVSVSVPAPAAPPIESVPAGPPGASDAITGVWLREARERHGMSLEDVSRLTKIPLTTLKAIESDNLKALPARVYLQGFVSNLLKTYRVDAKNTKLYLEHIDKLLRPPAIG